MKTLEKNNALGFNKVAVMELNTQQLTDANSGRLRPANNTIVICDWTFGTGFTKTGTIIYSCFCNDPKNS